MTFALVINSATCVFILLMALVNLRQARLFNGMVVQLTKIYQARSNATDVRIGELSNSVGWLEAKVREIEKNKLE